MAEHKRLFLTLVPTADLGSRTSLSLSLCLLFLSVLPGVHL